MMKEEGLSKNSRLGHLRTRIGNYGAVWRPHLLGIRQGHLRT